MQPVILCGGSGTRLWPLSREYHPKPLHAVNGERTLLQETALRCQGEPLVICNETHRFLVQEQLRRAGIRPRAILLESKGRGTAAALTLAAVHAITADDPVLLAMPSDHFIPQRDAFHQAVARGAALAEQGNIVAFGVPPVSPETGYGYIRARGDYVEAFVEKPDAAKAAEYVASGQYLWNAGIFAVRASVWLDAIGEFRPDIFKACERAYRQGKRDGSFYRVDPATFAECPSDSIDYAVMEKITDAMVVRLDAGWSDVGAWDALWDIETKNADGNVIHGDVHAADTRNALLIAQHRLLACVGLEDVVVIETADAVMVAHKDKAQAIGPLVAQAQGRRPRRVLRAPQGAPALGQLRRHRKRRALPGEAHRGRPGCLALAADALPPRRALDRGARHRARDARRRDLPAHRERINLYPAGHAPPPGEPGQDAARADRGAVRRLPGRGRHRQVRRCLRQNRVANSYIPSTSTSGWP